MGGLNATKNLYMATTAPTEVLRWVINYLVNTIIYFTANSIGKNLQ